MWFSAKIPVCRLLIWKKKKLLSMGDKWLSDHTVKLNYCFKKKSPSPGYAWVAGLVGTLSQSCTPTVYGFDSWSGHIPRLQVWCPVRACTGGNWLKFLASMFLSPSSSPPFSLKPINISSGEKKKSPRTHMEFPYFRRKLPDISSNPYRTFPTRSCYQKTTVTENIL